MADKEQLPFGRASEGSAFDTDRYARQVILPEIGVEGQARLGRARALVLGAGGLGSPAILYLAAAGVGEIIVVDDDAVDLSNLQRQVLYRLDDLGRPKPEAAAGQVAALNPACRIVPVTARLTDARQVRELLPGIDVALDCCDTFDTRFLFSDCCWIAGVPLVSAAAIGFSGQLQVIDPRAGTACYRCLVPEMPPAELTRDCRTGGILGPVTGVMGSLQAAEAIKVIVGIDSEWRRHLLHYDGLAGRFITMRRTRDPRCALCGGAPTITEPASIAGRSCGSA